MGNIHTETLTIMGSTQVVSVRQKTKEKGDYQIHIPIIHKIMKNGIYRAVRIVIIDSNARPL